MSRWETPSNRLRRLSAALVRAQDRHRDIRNKGAALSLKRQERDETEADRRREVAQAAANLRAQQTGQPGYEDPTLARRFPGLAKEAIARNIEALRRGGQPVEALAPEQRTRLAFATPEEIQAAIERGNIAEAVPEERGATAGTLGPRGFLNQALLQPVVTPEMNPLPGSAGRLTSALTTPVGLGVAAAFPGATATGLVGGTALGEAGRGLEKAGVPVVETPIGGVGPRGVGEVVGGALGLSETRAIARAGTQRLGRGLEEAGGIGALPRRLATEERGAIGGIGRESKPVWEQSFEEIQANRIAEQDLEKNSAKIVFGDEGAKRYESAQRTANSFTASRERQAAADATIAEMEKGLTPEQQRVLFGIGETGPNAEDLRGIEKAISRLDLSSPQALGDSLKWAISRIRPGVDPTTLGGRDLEAYTQLRYAMRVAQEAGWDTRQVSDAALRGAAGRFTDPEDAALILEDFIRPQTAPQRLALASPETAAPPPARVAVAEPPPPREPPAPPQEPPAGGLPPGAPPPQEPPWEEVRDKITSALRSSKAVTGAQATELSLERSRRIGNYRDLVAQNRASGMGQQEAERTARGALGGEVEKVPGLKIEFSEPETEALFRRINDFDYGTEPFLQPRASVAIGKLIDQTPLQTNEIDVLRRIYGEQFGDALDRAARGGKKGWDDLFDVIVLPKTVLSAFDLSYPFRQGIMVAPRHPKEFFGNIPGMVRSFGSEEVAQRIDDVIKNDPTRRIITQANGSFAEASQGAINQNIGIIRPLATGERSAAEEGFLSRLGLKIPGVKQSSRAFITYGNKLRSDLASYWIKHWEDTGVDLTPERLESLGNLLNRLTGRGTLGRGQAANRVTQLMQAAWWSPQYRLSGPQAYAQLFHADPAIRKIAAQNLAAFVGGGVGLLGLLKASGAADVDPNPFSTDFGKIRVGPFRANFWGSQQLLARSVAQAVSGKKFDPGLGTNKPFPRGETALSYFRSGLAPEWSLIYDILKGENYLGEDLKLDPDEALDRLAPIALQDTIKAYQVGGPLAAAATAPASVFGLSTSTYETDLSNQLQGIGQYRGIDPQLENELQSRGGFYDQVEAFQKNTLDQTNVKPETAPSIVAVAKQQGKDTDFIRTALLLRPGSKTEKALRNPEWLKFVYDNRDALRGQRPDLVDPNEGAPDYIIRYINAREMQKASGE